MADYLLTISDEEVLRYQLMAETAERLEKDLWDRAGIVEGARVADIGCGPGAVLVAMAQRVGPSGRVDGVDGDPAPLAIAEQLIARAGLTNASVREGPVDATGLEPGAYDVVVMRHVLAHNGGAEQRIIDHLATLVRPGGTVYLVDILFTGGRVVPEPTKLASLNEAYLALHTARGNDLSIGLRLGQLLTAAGLTEVEHSGRYNILEVPPGLRPPSWVARDAMMEAGLATADDVAAWAQAFEESDARSERPTMFWPLFIGTGRRPA